MQTTTAVTSDRVVALLDAGAAGGPIFKIVWRVRMAGGARKRLHGRSAAIQRQAHLITESVSAPGLVIDSFEVGDVEQLMAPGVPVELFLAIHRQPGELPDVRDASGPDVMLELFNSSPSEIEVVLALLAPIVGPVREPFVFSSQNKVVEVR